MDWVSAAIGAFFGTGFGAILGTGLTYLALRIAAARTARRTLSAWPDDVDFDEYQFPRWGEREGC